MAFGQKYSQAKHGGITRRCKAVTSSGPCKNWTEFEFCAAHEWKVNEAVMSTRQSFILLFPRAVARLAKVIDEPDSEIALKGIMVTLKYMLGDKLATDGLDTNELEHLTQEELIAKASRAIAALQQPLPEGERGEPGVAAAAAAAAAAAGPLAGPLAGPQNGLTAPGQGVPSPGHAAGPGAPATASEAVSEPSETAELKCGV